MTRWMLAATAAAALAWAPAHADQALAIQAARIQPKAVDVSVDTGGNMYVLVKPEKIAWQQYASAMCEVVKPFQGRIFRVRVIDLTKAKPGAPKATWDRLADAPCGAQ